MSNRQRDNCADLRRVSKLTGAIKLNESPIPKEQQQQAVVCSAKPRQGELRFPAGLTSLMINNTVFVDAVYGDDLVGVREDESKPFKTLVGAFNAAQVGDCILVHPGVYDDVLTIDKNVDLFFEQGASVVSLGPIFTVSVGVKTSIVGYGDFSSETQILQSQGDAADITFKAERCVGMSAQMFNLAGTTTVSKVNIEGTSFIAQGATSVLYVDGKVDLVFKAERMSSANTLVMATSQASGTMVLDASTMSASGRAFVVNASQFTMDIKGAVLNSESDDYALDIDVSAENSVVRCNFDFQQINAIGGVVSMVGPAMTNDPASICQFNLNTQKIFVNNSPTTTMRPFNFVDSISNVQFNLMLVNVNGTGVTTIFNIGNGAIVSASGREMACFNAAGTQCLMANVVSSMANVQAQFFINCSLIYVQMAIANVASASFSNASLSITATLLQSDQNARPPQPPRPIDYPAIACNVEVNSYPNIDINVTEFGISHDPGTVNSIDGNGNFHFRFENMNVSASSMTGTGGNTGSLINTVAVPNQYSNFYMSGQSLYLNEAAIGINIGGGPDGSTGLYLKVSQLNANNITNRALSIQGQARVDAQDFYTNNVGDGMVVSGNAQLQIGQWSQNSGNIDIGVGVNAALRVLTNGYVTGEVTSLNTNNSEGIVVKGGSGCNCNVGSINVSAGAAVRVLQNGNFEAQIGSIYVQNGATSAFNVAGSARGSVNSINVGNDGNGITVLEFGFCELRVGSLNVSNGVALQVFEHGNFQGEIDNISVQNYAAINNAGGVSARIGNINANNAADAIIISGLNGHFNGSVYHISTDRGSALSSISNNNIYLTFNTINMNGDSNAICLNLTGDGDTWISGHQINVNTCQRAVMCGNGTGQQLSFDVFSVFVNQADDVFYINCNYGGALVRMQDFRVNNALSNAAFTCLGNSQVVVNGGVFMIGGGVSGPATMFFINGEGTFVGKVDSANSPGSILVVDSTGSLISYVSESSVTNGDFPVVNVINSPNTWPTVGGSMTCYNHANCIELNGTVAGLKLKSSTLVSAGGGNSIYSFNPTNVTVQPSSANNATSANVTISPTVTIPMPSGPPVALSALFVDPTVA